VKDNACPVIEASTAGVFTVVVERRRLHRCLVPAWMWIILEEHDRTSRSVHHHTSCDHRTRRMRGPRSHDDGVGSSTHVAVTRSGLGSPLRIMVLFFFGTRSLVSDGGPSLMCPCFL